MNINDVDLEQVFFAGSGKSQTIPPLKTSLEGFAAAVEKFDKTLEESTRRRMDALAELEATMERFMSALGISPE